MSDIPVGKLLKHEISKLQHVDRCIWIIYHIFTFTLSRYYKENFDKIYFFLLFRTFFFKHFSAYIKYFNKLYKDVGGGEGGKRVFKLNICLFSFHFGN